MKKHLSFICFSFFYLGFGCGVQQMGIKAGLGLWLTIILFTTSVICYVVMMFTSMQKMKEFIDEKENEIKFDFEKQKKDNS